MLPYCGLIFLPQVANAIGGDDPRAGLRMGQGTTTFVSGRLTTAMVGTGPQPATHYPWPFPSIERCPAAARNSSCFKISVPALAR